MNPLAIRLVDLLPETIAPNTITLVGFVHALIPMVVLYTVFGAALIGDLP